MVSRWGYLWGLVRHSFHGTLRTLELGEAIVAMIVYTAGYFIPEWKNPLEVLFVALLGLLVLTFFFGLFLAAYASQKEVEDLICKLKDDESDVEADKRRVIHSQVAELNRTEIIVLNHMIQSGQLTDMQIAEFCDRKKLEIITPDMLCKRGVTFINREPSRGAWSVLPLMDSAARNVMSKVMLNLDGKKEISD